LEDLRAAGDVLVQRFVPEVVWPGEWSFVFVGQEYSHSVLKRPAAGDFRVQEEFGGQIGDEAPSASLVSEAGRIAAWIPRPGSTRGSTGSRSPDN
jgi:hypothetical protein